MKRCRKQGTQSWCSRTTQRDGVGREMEGVVFRMGDTSAPMADSCQCVARATTVLWSDYPPTKKKKNPAANARDSVNPWVRKISWSGKWQPTLVFLPWESHGQKSPVGYSLWGRIQLSMRAHTHTLRYADVRPPGHFQGLKINQFHDGKCHWESSL